MSIRAREREERRRQDGRPISKRLSAALLRSFSVQHGEKSD